MALVLTTEEKLNVLRQRLTNLRNAYAENELSLELLQNDPESEANEQLSKQQAGIRRQNEQIERNVEYISAQVEALEDVKIDEAFDKASRTNGKARAGRK